VGKATVYPYQEFYSDSDDDTCEVGEKEEFWVRSSWEGVWRTWRW
jgi:hypothetical protein